MLMYLHGQIDGDLGEFTYSVDEDWHCGRKMVSMYKNELLCKQQGSRTFFFCQIHPDPFNAQHPVVSYTHFYLILYSRKFMSISYDLFF